MPIAATVENSIPPMWGDLFLATFILAIGLTILTAMGEETKLIHFISGLLALVLWSTVIAGSYGFTGAYNAASDAYTMFYSIPFMEIGYGALVLTLLILAYRTFSFIQQSFSRKNEKTDHDGLGAPI